MLRRRPCHGWIRGLGPGRMMFIVESVGKEEACPRCSFTPEFKVESVEVCRRGDRSVGQVAKGFDLTEAASAAGSVRLRSTPVNVRVAATAPRGSVGCGTPS